MPESISKVQTEESLKQCKLFKHSKLQLHHLLNTDNTYLKGIPRGPRTVPLRSRDLSALWLQENEAGTRRVRVRSAHLRAGAGRRLGPDSPGKQPNRFCGEQASRRGLKTGSSSITAADPNLSVPVLVQIY